MQNAKYEEIAVYDKTVWSDYITQYDIDSFEDETLKRRLNKMRVLGTSALPADDYAQVQYVPYNVQSGPAKFPDL